jgi:hypothetical protein
MTTVVDGSAGVTTNSGAIYNGIASGTAVASTSGTSIDFTGIPSWVKRVTVMFQGVSGSGTSNHIIQLGTGGTPTYTTTGYLGTCSNVASASASSTQMSTGFLVTTGAAAAALYHGIITLVLINPSTNAWAESGSLGRSDSNLGYFSGGTLPLGSVLTAVRITTVNGTDTFDAGSINILYE